MSDGVERQFRTTNNIFTTKSYYQARVKVQTISERIYKVFDLI